MSEWMYKREVPLWNIIAQMQQNFEARHNTTNNSLVLAGCEEIVVDCQTSDSGGTTLVLFWLDQLHTFCLVLKGSWEFVQLVHMCFLGLEKPFNCTA